jgi:hypothetical protein
MHELGQLLFCLFVDTQAVRWNERTTCPMEKRMTPLKTCAGLYALFMVECR